jgi:hypothetical protein
MEERMTAFKYLDRDSTSPMMRFKVVTPSDANDLPTSSSITWPVRGLHNKGTGGVVSVVNKEGDQELFYIPQGGNLPVYCVRVRSTGTTIGAGDLIAFG